MGRFYRAGLIAAALWASPGMAADIAVDLSSGSILTATDADAPRLPASLTKLMTAYVAFEAMAAGEITPETVTTVSRFAAQRPPVKLNLRAGSTIPFDEVLGAAIVGSKNDAATVVAEAVAGTQDAFVDRMNAAADRLGMSNTRFANPTGLPKPDQQTTARDMAILATALLTNFPERSKLFSRRSVTALGRRVSTTNPLFGRVNGAQGLKTGFTCAAGYSIAALVERDGRRIIAVTLGNKTKAERLSAARGLIEAAFKLSGTGATLTPAAPNTAGPPDIGACSGAPATLMATDISPEEKALYAAELAKARQRVALRLAEPRVQPTPVATIPPPLSGWGVFLGAHPTRQSANAKLRALHDRLGGRGTIGTEARRRDGFTLALLYGLDRETASAICKRLTSYCIVLPPASLLNRRAEWRK